MLNSIFPNLENWYINKLANKQILNSRELKRGEKNNNEPQKIKGLNTLLKMFGNLQNFG